jgi:hypothetical protein
MGENMKDNTTFIFDIKEFDTYKFALQLQLNNINFLGVRDVNERIIFINLKDVRQVIMYTGQIRIEYENYYYVITPEGIEHHMYTEI